MRFWPAIDPAQLDYERLREMAGGNAPGRTRRRSASKRGGLMALIKKPTSSALPLIARLVEVPRPRWSPYVDPRLEALADAYALLAAAAPDPSLILKELAT